MWHDIGKPAWFSIDDAVYPHDFFKDLALMGMTWAKVPGSPIKYNIEEYGEGRGAWWRYRREGRGES
jgi:hypothetical protein